MESLYCKYRPQTFDSMVGQKHIVKMLENALADGRTSHAYLFCGPRGTGKTTTARLLAKALLCEKGPTAHPDGTCEQCEEIAAGTHPDVYELDAASRTGVDNVREEIINRVAFAPTRGRYKIYIIDEVHMLSTSAFNALLKTFEEPPDHVIFVMCTTDPQKIPATVLSRCQRLEFHRIGDEDIEERLRFVCESEGFTYDDDALKLVAKHANGGLRDALSTLEQLAVFGGGKVRMEDAQSVLGEVPDDTLEALVRMVAARDVAGCFAQVAGLAERGVDVPQYARDLTRFMRNVYMVAVAGEKALGEDASGAKYKELAGELGGADRVAYVLDVLGRLESDLRTSLDQRLSLELALTRMARPAGDLTLESLVARVDDLERQLAALKASGAPAASGAAASSGASCGFGAPAAQGAAAAFSGSAAPALAGAPAQTRAAHGAAGMSGAPGGRPAYGNPAAAGRSAVPARPAAPGAAAPASAAMPAVPAVPVERPQTSMDPGTVQRLWAQTVQEVMQSVRSVGALLQNAEGILSDDGTLTVINHGAAFAAQMLSRPASMSVLTKAASRVYGQQVRVSVVGAGAGASPTSPAGVAAPAAPVQQRPAAGTAPVFGQPAARGAAPRPAAAGYGARAQTPAGAVAPAAPPAPTGFAGRSAAPAPASAPAAPTASVAPTASAAPVSAPAQRPVGAARVPSAAAIAAAAAAAVAEGTAGSGTFAPVTPAAPAAPTPASPAPAALAAPAGPAEGDSFEFVPDEVYDAYDDRSDDDASFSPDAVGIPPWEAPAQPAPAAPGAASAPAAGPSQAPGASKASQDQEGFGGRNPEAAPLSDPVAVDLAQLLSAGFGGYVKITDAADG